METAGVRGVETCSQKHVRQEKVWTEFLRDPTKWWDNRGKQCGSYPDFTHTSSGDSLWIASCPTWVQEKLASLEFPLENRRIKACYRVTTPLRTVSGYVAALKDCTKKRDLERGKKLDLNATAAGFHTNKYVATALVRMYSKCRIMQCAREVFDRMVQPDVVSWNCLLLGYVENGESSTALKLFTSMHCEPDSVTFLAVLKACIGLATEKQDIEFCLETGVVIHEQLKKRGFESDLVVANALLDMYGKCGSMRRARDLFDRMIRRDVISWTSLLLGYVENGESLVAIDLFISMDSEPDSFAYAAALKACAGLVTEEVSKKQVSLAKGMMIHNQVRERGYESDIVVATALVDMYCKCGNLQDARELFDRMVRRDVVSWNCVIMGCVENGASSVAIDLFRSMDCEGNFNTFVAALKACAGLATDKQSEKQQCLETGTAIHQQAKARGFISDVTVANALLHMYDKCGNMQNARELFNQMVHRDVVSWSSLIMGYVENGESSNAIDLFLHMDCQPNTVTFLAVMKACGNLAALANGQVIHSQICRLGFEQDEVISTGLVDFYGKCGRVKTAEHVFNWMHSPSIVSWTALIAGYSTVGDTYQVFYIAEEMQEAGLQMDSITFLCILTACSHAGKVEQGKTLFESMCKYGITCGIEHYNCMVDMLGRANRLQEALCLIQRMPFQADRVTWTSLLSACAKWKNLEVANVAFDALVGLNSSDAVAYVLMREIHEKLLLQRER